MTRLLAWLAAIALGLAFWWAILGLITGRGQVDLGGNVMQAWASAQHDTRPITGTCASACTMRLLRASCVASDALLGFHAATNEIATRVMLSMYAPALRAYVRENCLDGGVCWLSGATLGRFGYRVCRAGGAESR